MEYFFLNIYYYYYTYVVSNRHFPTNRTPKQKTNKTKDIAITR